MLHQPDYDTARAIAKVINERFPESAVSLDAGTINVNVPPGSLPNLVPFVSDVGLLEVTPDAIARVVINERTGTIVAGEQVKVATVAVAHANLSIVTELNLFGGIGGGGFGPDAELRVNEQAGTVKVLPGIPRTVTVAELARALNALGVTPRDLIAILQAIKRAGAHPRRFGHHLTGGRHASVGTLHADAFGHDGYGPLALSSQARSTNAQAIEKVANGFESIFLSQMLKQMRQSLEPGTMFGHDNGDVFGGMFDMFMSQHLAPAGASGIAAMVRKQTGRQTEDQGISGGNPRGGHGPSMRSTKSLPALPEIDLTSKQH